MQTRASFVFAQRGPAWGLYELSLRQGLPHKQFLQQAGHPLQIIDTSAEEETPKQHKRVQGTREP